MILMICSAVAEVTLIEDSSFDLTTLNWSDGQPKYIMDRPDAVEWLVMDEQLDAITEENKELRAQNQQVLENNLNLKLENAKLKDQAKYAYTIAGGSVLFAVLLAMLAR